ncbi:YlxR family protein [Christensenellaceae bacterium NSJ-44]|uniref:YlxR family protein n=1 Tax=Luoshenia tenuis TaxID=2763654 RepID=A0A926HND1_9FIRM|nr:YlxR family protein [Luoshenia tenuis]MBC8529011.1 YlxR family protein [Luoshenia tenuis]
MKTRKVPMRMCVGCREMKPKKELLRVVKSAEGDISFDRTGKQSGRGAYICASEACLQKAVKARMLERALDKKIDEALYDQLTRELLRREL